MTEPNMTTIISKSNRADTNLLCGSEHSFDVAYSSQNGVAVPIKDYIVVAFTPQDTSGGGKVEEYFNRIVSGVVSAPSQAGEALADWSRDRGVVYGEGVEGGFAKGYKESVDWTGTQIKKLKFWAEETSFSADSPFYTPYSSKTTFNTDWVGTEYHPVNAVYHRIRIKIYCTYEGIKSKKYDSELAGCSPLVSGDECIDCCDTVSISQFLINSPGTWEVEISPIASGSCSNPKYTDKGSFEVPTPEGWKPEPIEAAIRTLSDQVSLVTGTTVSPAIIAIGMALISGGLLFKVFKRKT
jgi:LPXTG-motif cell wall-anchored protein